MKDKLLSESPTTTITKKRASLSGRRALRVGTRGSVLARTQTAGVIDALRGAYPHLNVEVCVIRTTGDHQTTRPLPEIGGKGLFTREIEEALLDGEIDAAVHSLKDLPTELPPGLVLGATPARQIPFDALIARDGTPLRELPTAARIGTGSLRRAAQLKAIRPDLRVDPIRGNLDTRLGKLHSESWDGIVVAAAGLARVGRLDEATEILPPDVMLPAPGQGALAIELREDDEACRTLFEAIHDANAARAVVAERAFLDALGGGCHVPIAAYGRLMADETQLLLDGLVVSPDGRGQVRGQLAGTDAETVGRELAARLIEQGAATLLAAEVGP